MKRLKRDNLGQEFYIKTEKAPCRNTKDFIANAVKTAHQSRAVYNACIRILIDADDEDMPLRSGHGYEGPSLQEKLLELREKTLWLQDVSSNVRRSAAAQAHTAFGHWVEAQRRNAARLVKAQNMRRKRLELLTEAAHLRREEPAKYRRTREDTLKAVRTLRLNAPTVAGKDEKYARRNRDPGGMMRTRKYAEHHRRLTIALTADRVHFTDKTRTELRVYGFGDIPLKKPLPENIKPVSLTLVACVKRRHRKRPTPVKLEQLEWTAHIQRRVYIKQRRVTATCSSTGLDLGVKHPATTQDNRGRIAHYHYTGTDIPRGERRLKSLRQRRACCSEGSRRWERYNESIRQTSTRLTNLRDHQTVKMAKAIVGRKMIIGIEDFQADNARRSARSTNEAPGKNVAAKRGLNRSLSHIRPGKLKQEAQRESERCGAVWNLHPAPNTSRRCAQCGHTAKKNRESQAVFDCRECGHTANADANAAENVRQGSVSRILAKAERRKAARRGRRRPLPAAGGSRRPKPRRVPDRRATTGTPSTTMTRHKK